MIQPKIITILLNRIKSKPNPLPPGIYTVKVKNAVVDERTGNVVIQYETTDKE